MGKDSHKFAKKSDSKKRLIIGGVQIDDLPPFIARSDGDVLYHALFNAISSALGLGSIGSFFPSANIQEKNKTSRIYLGFIKTKLEDKQYKIANISISVECQKPKIDKISAKIKKNIATIFDIEEDLIGITATTGEGMTPWGKGEGVEVLSTILITN